MLSGKQPFHHWQKTVKDLQRQGKKQMIALTVLVSKEGKGFRGKQWETQIQSLEKGEEGGLICRGKAVMSGYL